jgi:glycogen(starch) synthase
MPGSPSGAGARTPGEFGTLTEELQGLSTSDYKGHQQFWKTMSQHGSDDEEEAYRFPLVIKSRNRGTSVGSMSGASTPGLGGGKFLSSADLDRADAALSNHAPNGH